MHTRRRAVRAVLATSTCLSSLEWTLQEQPASRPGRNPLAKKAAYGPAAAAAAASPAGSTTMRCGRAASRFRFILLCVTDVGG